MRKFFHFFLSLALWGCSQFKANIAFPDDKSGIQIAEVIWRKSLIDSDIISFRVQHRSAPTVSPDGKWLLVGTSIGNVFCMDTSTGYFRWSFRGDEPTDVEILVTDKAAYFAVGDGSVYAIALEDGKVIWKKHLGKIITAAPVIYSGKLYIQTDDDELFCIEADNGESCLQTDSGRRGWQYKHQSIIGERYRVIGNSRPLVTDDAIYASFSDGVLVKLSHDGKILAKRSLSQEKDKFWDADVDPILAGGMLLAGSFFGGVFALNPEDLSTIWNTQLEGPSDLTIVEDKIYLTTSQSEIVALSLKDGTVLWKNRMEKAGLLSAPMFYRPWLFVCSEELSFLVIDSSNGKLKQTFHAGKGCSARPAIYNRSVWWISNGETVYHMNINE